jgi:hypothetical protein
MNKNNTRNVAMHNNIIKHENPIKNVATGLTADCKLVQLPLQITLVSVFGVFDPTI